MNEKKIIMSRSKKPLCIIALLTCVFFLTACMSELTKSDSGTAIGGLIGGALGSQIGGGNKTSRILIGAAAGAVIGRIVGGYMDDSDRQRVTQSLNESEPGKTTAWKNEKTGKAYELTSGKSYHSPDGNECREFTQEVIVNGKREKVNGTACKEPESDQWDMT